MTSLHCLKFKEKISVESQLLQTNIYKTKEYMYVQTKKNKNKKKGRNPSVKNDIYILSRWRQKKTMYLPAARLIVDLFASRTRRHVLRTFKKKTKNKKKKKTYTWIYMNTVNTSENKWKQVKQTYM